MPERATTTCIVGDCDELAVDFKHFPTVEGYCLAHGNVLADFLTLIDDRTVLGFNNARFRWERARRYVGDPD